MYTGHNIGLEHEVFDFADAITFHAIKNGAKIMFLPSTGWGGQDENGSKVNGFQANLHLDAGAHLVHFGGAGSGCVFYNNPNGKNESYGRWAVIRYKLFCEIFLDKEVSADAGETKFGDDGRWISGNYDESIVKSIRAAILNEF